MTMFLYEISPIDHWGDHSALKYPKEFFVWLMECAYRIARSDGFWEGDIHELQTFSVPDPENQSFATGVVWKQRNNGTCFVCSPVPLPYLEESGRRLIPEALPNGGTDV